MKRIILATTIAAATFAGPVFGQMSTADLLDDRYATDNEIYLEGAMATLKSANAWRIASGDEGIWFCLPPGLAFNADLARDILIEYQAFGLPGIDTLVLGLGLKFRCD